MTHCPFFESFSAHFVTGEAEFFINQISIQSSIQSSILPHFQENSLFRCLGNKRVARTAGQLL